MPKLYFRGEEFDFQQNQKLLRNEDKNNYFKRKM